MTDGMKLGKYVQKKLATMKLELNHKADISDITGGSYEPESLPSAIADVNRLVKAKKISYLISLLRKLPLTELDDEEAHERAMIKKYDASPRAFKKACRGRK